MKVRSIVAGAAALALTASLATASGAQAGDTATTLTVTAGGALTIANPATANLGSLAAGSSLASAPVALGTVTVTDTRTGLLNNNWVASVATTDFVKSGTTTPDETTSIPKASVGYAPGTVTNATGSPTAAVATPTSAASLTAVTPVVSMVSVGTNGASWSPTMSFTIGDLVLAGTYAATVTHSVL